MTKREELQLKAKGNFDKIQLLRKENSNIEKDLLLLSDDKQWFVEKIETTTEIVNRKKVTVDRLIGRVFWKEDFKDDETGEVVTVERNQVVRVDGNWDY